MAVTRFGLCFSSKIYDLIDRRVLLALLNKHVHVRTYCKVRYSMQLNDELCLVGVCKPPAVGVASKLKNDEKMTKNDE